MTLLHRQAAFMAQVLDDEAPAPSGWGNSQAAGMEVYRNNYRSSLVEALRGTFERTAQWVGGETFERAAAHHLISHPPHSWTLDEAGRGFEVTCAELFVNDPEVAELAWLEWAMFECFTAPDASPLDAAQFATATGQFRDEDWANLRLQFMPGSASALVNHDLRAIWKATAGEECERPDVRLDDAAGILVWREGERSTFRMVAANESQAFEAMSKGVSYGETCVTMAGEAPSEETMQEAAMQEAAMQAGAMLGGWLRDGLVQSLSE